MSNLNSKDKLISLTISLGIKNWNELTNYVQNLPYGRNENRHDLSLILKEQKGTCSLKHAFLKKIADFNQLENIKLYIGIYEMNNSNTPKIGNILSENEFEYRLDYIPEAHCYLKVNGIEHDFTNNDSDFEKLKNDILEEIEIEAYQVNQFKVSYHQDFLKKWVKEQNIKQNTKQNKMSDNVISFDNIWQLREQCISALASTDSL